MRVVGDGWMRALDECGTSGAWRRDVEESCVVGSVDEICVTRL